MPLQSSFSNVFGTSDATEPKQDTAFLSDIIDTQNDLASVELDQDLIMQVVAERIQKLANADGATVQLIEGDVLVCRSVTGIIQPHNGMKLPLAASLAGRAVNTASCQYAQDCENDSRLDRDLARRVGARSIVAVPLMHNGHGLGVIIVVSSRPSAFESRHIAALRLMAGLVVASLSHASEFEIKKRLLAERTATLSSLRQSGQQFRNLFEYASDAVFVNDLNGRFLDVNVLACQGLGYSREELLSMSVQDVAVDFDISRVGQIWAQLELASPVTVDAMHVRRDGSRFPVEIRIIAIEHAGKKAILAIVRDVTDRKHAEWLERDRRGVLEMVALGLPLADVLDQLAQAVERQITGSSAAVFMLQNGSISLHGPMLPKEWRQALQLCLLSLARTLSAGIWDSGDPFGVTLIESDPVWNELRPVARDHGIRACWSVAIQSTDGTPLGLLTVFCARAQRPTAAEAQTLDMCAKLATICIDHHQATGQLSHLVRHDRLTGLPNRLMFDDRIQQALALAARTGKQVGLLAMDIDKFKNINDSLGHHAGDQLLQQFAQRLRGQLRESDTMARIGGDEFVVVLPELESADGPSIVAQKMVESLGEPFALGDSGVRATTSIGIARFPQDGRDPVMLMKRADAALYRAKALGGDGYSYYSTTLTGSIISLRR